nr:hypothetical protein [uncultured Desulfobulbus sp.]
MFKQISLPSHIPGQMYLHAMPGRHEHIDQFMSEIHKLKIEAVVCLTNEDEIRYKSPDYYSMRLRKQHAFEIWSNGIPQKFFRRE